MSPDRHTADTTPASRSPVRRADAERNRTALISAARRLFEEHGTGVALDEVARLAQVANATLYRHFATRAELIVAVYGAEVDDLQHLGDQLASTATAERALDQWLRAFAHHVATKRDLAMAAAQRGVERGELFGHWHAVMHDIAARLFSRAQHERVVRSDLSVDELLALVAGIALADLPPVKIDKLLELIRHGYRAHDPHPSRADEF